ncbi:MAG: hypothetical protein IKL96_07475 [Kiritimatiellae bacterium]|nr:hypothetical protein [Kiritimatiellia bacterium]
MKIKEIQKMVTDALNGVEALVQGGCTALAEDSNDVFFEVRQSLEAGNVCIVVTTPKVTRSASGSENGIPVEMQLAVQCAERPDLNRAAAGHLTALDAAEIVAHALDGETFELLSIEQWADERTRTVTATATFGFNPILTDPTKEN